MTFVVTEACIRCKYTVRVDVCPVDAFQKGPNFLVIDPAECIDCTIRVPECPVEAIYAEDDVPSDRQAFTPLHAELARVWKPITRTKAALPDTDEWAKLDNKRSNLRRRAPGEIFEDLRPYLSIMCLERVRDNQARSSEPEKT